MWLCHVNQPESMYNSTRSWKWKKTESEKAGWKRLVNYKVCIEEQDMEMTQENTGIATNEKNIMISNAIREIAWKYFIETRIDKKPIFHNVTKMVVSFLKKRELHKILYYTYKRGNTFKINNRTPMLNIHIYFYYFPNPT